MAKHIIYLKEGSDAAVSTASHLQKFHQGASEAAAPGPRCHAYHAPDQPNAHSESCAIRRMEIAHDQPATTDAEYHQPRKKSVRSQISELMLTDFQSFNVVTQHDSHVLKNDSKSMKAIASVTIAFLPLATIAVREHSFPRV
jgi:hypothetical protein